MRRKAGDVLALARSGVDLGMAGPQGVTVAQAIEQHIAAPRQKPLEESTVEYYRKLLRDYLAPLASVPLLRLDQTAIIKLRDKLHNEHGP